ncbi:uncharacterized protein LOC107757109 [Sinocyclocheilus rhinocerous]|uniref:uncharacterized protein LOC107757109 n=1 Tax=Sinocyclocheilus rhinocerous TaxID=307959 RepID=UPI0007BA8F2A|nr:PREDICTED: uncharacterized protein LOC107757109 [Sinocyclocheilus rhinocerous]XP_016429973.1 PREDICTED: uncharacterized protein LOC107757109 [Sinocyclocheilus rhinocerous]
MNTSFCYPDFHPNMENILSVKRELKENNISDSILLSNLDFAERFFRDHPLKEYSKLVVKGDYFCVQIGGDVTYVFTVTSEDNQTYVHVFILARNKIISIDANQFYHHSCQDEIKSCFTQALEAVTDEDLTSLHIICNRFSVMYSTRYRGPRSTVETKCQLKLENITAESLLNKKVWLQKEKATCHGLIACLDHLIIQYLTTPDAPKSNCSFIIHADKEVMRITTGEQDERVFFATQW